MTKIMRFFGATIIAVAVSLVAVTPAQADPYPYTNCNSQYVSTVANYNAGSYWVSTTGWYDWFATSSAACRDINVEMGDTGVMTVRTVVCQSGQPCYALAWGSLNSFTRYGVTAHYYHLPCNGGCNFLFRIETSSTNYPSNPAESFFMHV